MLPLEDLSGPFRRPGDLQICEHMPMVAQQMHNLSVVRSMSTREADHNRGRYYMHTGFVFQIPILSISWFSDRETLDQRHRTRSTFPYRLAVRVRGILSFLGMAWAPFSVTSNGRNS